MTTNLGGLIDAENGLIEPEIYAQELERIFARCWLFSHPRLSRSGVAASSLERADGAPT